LTKLRNDELPSVKDADLVNYVVLASVYTYTNSSYHTAQPLAAGKMRTADLQNVQWVSMWMVTKP